MTESTAAGQPATGAAGTGDYLQRIVSERRARIAVEGTHQGIALPAEPPSGPRALVRGTLICEYKRRSPSKGVINDSVDAPTQAAEYQKYGARAMSILTEERYFGGSLADLMAVRRAHPGVWVLRKDFLLTPGDIETSYRAGADGVLVIAAALSGSELKELLQCAEHYGLTALVEIHNREDLEKVAPLAPGVVGINCRDLTTFRVDRLAPLGLIQEIDWECQVVYESGITCRETAQLAVRGGFSSLLVGEAFMREPRRIPEVLSALGEHAGAGERRYRFWSTVAKRAAELRTPAAATGRPPRPLVKICGITNREDADTARACGADILGFVRAPSPRRIDSTTLAGFADYPGLKVVIVTDVAASISELTELWDAGCIDAVQLHNPARGAADNLEIPYFAALTIDGPDDIAGLAHWYRTSPRVLVDCRHDAQRMHKSEPLADAVIADIGAQYPLWVAGGLTPENIPGLVTRFHPELIDISNGVEASHGRKSQEKIRRLFANITDAVGAGVGAGAGTGAGAHE